LSDVWDDLKYANFRSKIHTYRTWIDDAYGEQDRDESIGKWRRVFGNDYAKTVAIERAARVSTSARELVLSAPQARSQTHLDLVALFKQFGRSVLPTNFFRLPHKQRPPWRMSPSTQFSVRVSAALHANRNGPSIGPVTSGQPLKKNNWLRFQVNTDIGAPISKDFQIYWRVTNTDEEARQAKQLRGGFEKCNDGSNRWETLSYRGIHTIEAFVVRTRDDTLVAQSEPFLVLVE
jgi:hypothetical protein